MLVILPPLWRRVTTESRTSTTCEDKHGLGRCTKNNLRASRSSRKPSSFLEQFSTEPTSKPTTGTDRAPISENSKPSTALFRRIQTAVGAGALASGRRFTYRKDCQCVQSWAGFTMIIPSQVILTSVARCATEFIIYFYHVFAKVIHPEGICRPHVPRKPRQILTKEILCPQRRAVSKPRSMGPP